MESNEKVNKEALRAEFLAYFSQIYDVYLNTID